MDYKKLTSPCGIDCFNCEAYEKNITEEMQAYLAKVLKKSKEDVMCKGCRIQGRCVLYPFPCEILECAKTKVVEFCFECCEFPCEKLNPCVDKAEKYPHNLKVYNLCKISRIGVDKWAEEAKQIRETYYKGKFTIGRGSCQGPKRINNKLNERG
ncbi:DUF3795 domain-containing protein [Maledivibacter halophilus]|uniref:DUF3795 domain-containing protein n=1 Tax=Maledivibacter halophilus TaxID=36842 RepID=A0A1T5LTQ0_9FIRM|nr:DUF3795 domain-containing protein [Maledivibacter halophilus]SKC78928.1 Protein of unknown function [Maledivibacter halophilus]